MFFFEKETYFRKEKICFRHPVKTIYCSRPRGVVLPACAQHHSPLLWDTKLLWVKDEKWWWWWSCALLPRKWDKKCKLLCSSSSSPVVSVVWSMTFVEPEQRAKCQTLLSEKAAKASTEELKEKLKRRLSTRTGLSYFHLSRKLAVYGQRVIFFRSFLWPTPDENRQGMKMGKMEKNGNSLSTTIWHLYRLFLIFLPFESSRENFSLFLLYLQCVECSSRKLKKRQKKHWWVMFWNIGVDIFSTSSSSA